MGRKFYERDFPQLVQSLDFIGQELKRANILKKQEKFETSENNHFSLTHDQLARIIIETEAYFLLDEIAKVDCKSAQILDVLVGNYRK
jgi:hypothetical protein